MYKTDHQILGIEQTADKEEIKAAYRKLVIKYHPDRNAGNEREASAEFIKIQGAYDRLTGTNFALGGSVDRPNEFEEMLRRYFRNTTPEERRRQAEDAFKEVFEKHNGNLFSYLISKLKQQK